MKKRAQFYVNFFKYAPIISNKKTLYFCYLFALISIFSKAYELGRVDETIFFDLAKCSMQQQSRFIRLFFLGHIVALNTTIRLHMGGTHRSRTVQTPFRLTPGDTISRIYEQQRPRAESGSLSRCKPATPLSWNSGVLMMLGRGRYVATTRGHPVAH